MGILGEENFDGKNELDNQLEEIIKHQAARIKVIGIGGAGNNTISRMREVGIKGGQIIAINTDAIGRAHV